MNKSDIEILKGLISLIKCNNGKFSSQDVVMLKGVNELLKVFNDRWITVHPHGKDKKGQPLLVKEGETNKDAIDKKYGKEDIDTETLYDELDDYIKESKETKEKTDKIRNKEWQETLKRRDKIGFQILSLVAQTKDKHYSDKELKMLLGAMRNGDVYKNGLHKRCEKLQTILLEASDQITTNSWDNSWSEFYNKPDDDVGEDAKLVEKVLNDYLYNRSEPVSKQESEIEKYINEAEKYAVKQYRKMQLLSKKELNNNFLDIYSDLEQKYGDVLSEQIYNIFINYLKNNG